MSEDPEPSYSLEELADLTGLERRAIRGYIEQGLLRGPYSRGRYATYSRYHLDRLLAITALRERRGMAVTDIRQALMTMSEEEVRTLAASIPAGNAPAPPESSPSALGYLRALRARTSPPASKPGPSYGAMVANAALAPSPTLSRLTPATARGTPIDQLLTELEKLFPPNSAPRRAEGEPWFRIAVTPEFELSVRGVQPPDQLARLERIADYLREILLGGLPS